jgi:formate hydrogenlyase subunit 6/NADH:ubiquinone oxidoreductase subunit I
MSGIPIPELDLVRCDGCGRCVEVCPDQALQLVGGRPRLVADSDCTYCGRCEDTCPTGALALVYEIVIGGEG